MQEEVILELRSFLEDLLWAKEKEF